VKVAGWKKAKKHEDDWSYHLERMMEDMLQEFAEWDDWDTPLVYGFKMKKDASGTPVVEEFGNVKREDGKHIVSEEREPLVDVISEEESVTIIVELPGVQKEDITIRSPDKHSVIIKVGGQNSFYKKLAFEQKLKPGSSKAKFNNGILEVKIKAFPVQSGTEIKVE